MHEASYGFPPDNPNEVVWLRARQFVALQGVEPKRWTVKPHCPHCKCVMELQDAKGTKNFHLADQELSKKPENIRSLSRAVVGFKHPRNRALPDCPYSYTNDPRYAYPEGRHTAERERRKNRELFAEPVMAENLQEVLRRLIQLLTKDPIISEQNQRRLNHIARAKVDGTQGLAEHYWIRPYMQAILFGVIRPIRPLETAVTAKPVVMDEPPSLFEGAAGELCEAKKPKRQRQHMNERCWQPYGPIRKLEYMSVNGETRILEVPTRMRLCFVYRQELGVSYVPILVDGKPVIFDVTHAWAKGIVKKLYARKKKSPERSSKRREDPKQVLLL